MSDALRLRLRTTGDSIEVRDVKRLSMRAPRSADAAVAARTGRFVELNDDDGETLYQQLVETVTSHEVPTGDPERPLRRVPAKQPVDQWVVVPVTPGATRIVVTDVEAPARPATTAKGAKDKARKVTTAATRRERVSHALEAQHRHGVDADDDAGDQKGDR